VSKSPSSSDELLDGMGLDVFPVTSGSKGVHLYAPLDGTATSQEISDVAHELARSLEADHKDLIVSAMKKTLRENRVLIDWSQNSAAKTTVAPYSLRGRLAPTVAAPRTWAEFDDPTTVEQLRFEEVLDRLDDDGDLLESLTEATGGSVEAPQEPERDRLQVYRSRRDPKHTR
jgi:bifunctional non-homologous end joining protein LigD